MRSEGPFEVRSYKVTTERTPGRKPRVQAIVEVRVGGAETVEVSGPAAVIVTEIAGQGDDPSYLAVGTQPGLTLPDGRELVVRLLLRPGKWTGPGEYTLEPAGDGDPQTSDLAAVEVRESPGSPTSTVYERLGQPCTARFGDRAFSGSLDCPSLRHEGGTEVSLAFRWSGRPAPTPKPPITPPPT